MKKLQVNCPQCGKQSLWSSDNAFRPFCSERCRTLDLGAWANEEYQIPTEPTLDDYSSSFDEPENGMLPGSHHLH